MVKKQDKQLMTFSFNNKNLNKIIKFKKKTHNKTTLNKVNQTNKYKQTTKMTYHNKNNRNQNNDVKFIIS